MTSLSFFRHMLIQIAAKDTSVTIQPGYASFTIGKSPTSEKNKNLLIKQMSK